MAHRAALQQSCRAAENLQLVALDIDFQQIDRFDAIFRCKGIERFQPDFHGAQRRLGSDEGVAAGIRLDLDFKRTRHIAEPVIERLDAVPARDVHPELAKGIRHGLKGENPRLRKRPREPKRGLPEISAHIENRPERLGGRQSLQIHFDIHSEMVGSTNIDAVAAEERFQRSDHGVLKSGWSC